jgi:hypothetical protein
MTADNDMTAAERLITSLLVGRGQPRGTLGEESIASRLCELNAAAYKVFFIIGALAAIASASCLVSLVFFPDAPLARFAKLDTLNHIPVSFALGLGLFHLSPMFEAFGECRPFDKRVAQALARSALYFIGGALVLFGVSIGWIIARALGASGLPGSEWVYSVGIPMLFFGMFLAVLAAVFREARRLALESALTV